MSWWKTAKPGGCPMQSSWGLMSYMWFGLCVLVLIVPNKELGPWLPAFFLWLSVFSRAVADILKRILNGQRIPEDA